MSDLVPMPAFQSGGESAERGFPFSLPTDENSEMECV